MKQFQFRFSDSFTFFVPLTGLYSESIVEVSQATARTIYEWGLTCKVGDIYHAADEFVIERVS